MTSLDNYTSHLGELKNVSKTTSLQSRAPTFTNSAKNKTRLDLRIEIFIHASSFQPEAETQAQSLSNRIKRGGVKRIDECFDEKTHLLIKC